MPGLDLRVLVLERRWKNWEESLAGQPPVGGTGIANRVAYWNGTHQITADTSLYWDSVNDRLGIRTSTPEHALHVEGRIYSPVGIRLGAVADNAAYALNVGGSGYLSGTLQFASTEGAKLNLYGTTYGLGIGPGRTRVYGDASGGVSLGTVNVTTFTSRLEVTAGLTTSHQSMQFAASTGFGYTPVAGIWIRAGQSQFDRLGIGGAPDAGWGLRLYGNIYADNEVYAGYGLRVYGTDRGGVYTNVGSTAGTGNFSNHIAFGWDGAYVRVRVDNYQAGAMTLTFPSDRRLKQHVAEDTPGLALIAALRPVGYEYNQALNPLGFPHGRHYGLMADELAPLLPSAVVDQHNAEHWQMIRYDGLVPVLIKAVQELSARLDALEESAWP